MGVETKSEMMAISVAGGAGPAEALTPVQMPIPVPREGEILIEVKAAGVNRPDLLQRTGHYPPPPGASELLGLEVAGRVVKAAGRWQVGDRVCALVNGGGYAEYVACDSRQSLPVPDGLSWIEAASLPETVFTVYANVFEHGALKSGETLLLHGANSGIGVAAIQMAKLAGARVIATARGAEKAAQALALGADVAIDVTTQDFLEVVSREGGADVVLEMVGGDYFAKDLDSIKIGGRIVFIAAQGGSNVTLPVIKMMMKRAVVTGSTLRPRSPDEKARLASEIERLVWPWLNSGQMKPQIDKVFSLSSAAEAHAYLESGGHFGKVLLIADAVDA